MAKFDRKQGTWWVRYYNPTLPGEWVHWRFNWKLPLQIYRVWRWTRRDDGK